MDRHEREQFYDTRYRVGEQDVQGQLRHQEAQQLLQESLDQIPQEEFVEQQESQEPADPQRREGAPQPRHRQAYPDEGWADRLLDFTPLRNGGIGLAVLLTVGWLGIQAALNRLNSDSPSNEPKPVPTATLTPGQLRSVDVYNQLVQAEKKRDARLARSITIDSDINLNVRNRSSAVTGEIEGQFKPGQLITVDTIEVLGDDPNTPEVETNAGTWVAFRCADIRKELANIAPSSSVPPKEQDICFAYGQYVQRNK